MGFVEEVTMLHDAFHAHDSATPGALILLRVAPFVAPLTTRHNHALYAPSFQGFIIHYIQQVAELDRYLRMILGFLVSVSITDFNFLSIHSLASLAV